MEKQSKLTKFMEDKFVPAAASIGGQRHLLALRDGIVMIMPLLILGSFAMIIIEFPIKAWADMMERTGWLGHSDIIVDATFGIMAIIAAFGVASSLAGSYKKKNGEAIDGIPAGIISVATFFIVTNAGRTEDVISDLIKSESFTLGLNAENLFVAMLFAIFTAEVYRLFIQKEWVIKLPESVPLAISRQFSALLPGLAIFAISWLGIAVPMTYSGYHTISAFLNEGLFSWMKDIGLSYPITMLAAFLEHLMWSFGLHGSAIVIFPFFEPLWLSVSDGNLSSIITWTFYENGVWIGGSGATLPVVIYMLVFAKSKLLKEVGKVAIGPGIFNINEPVTFGLPVVLNPVLMIPYIVSPLVITTIMYFGTLWKIFPVLDKIVPWTTPIFVSGFLAATGGLFDKIMAVVAQLLCFVVAYLIWLPFIRSWDNVCKKREAGI